MDIEGFIGSTTIKSTCEKQYRAFKKIEALISEATTTDVEGMAFICLLLEEQLSRVPSQPWLFKIRLKKLKFECGFLGNYKDNMARIDLTLRLAKQINRFIIETMRRYAEHSRTVDSIYVDSLKQDYSSFYRHYNDICDGRVPKWGIKHNIDLQLQDKVKDVDIKVYRIKNPTIADTYIRMKTLPILDLTGCIHAQQKVHQIQDLYCELNNEWSLRYSGIFDLAQQPVRFINVIKGMTDISDVNINRIVHYFEYILYFNPYSIMVDLKESLICLCRELESWVTVSHRRF